MKRARGVVGASALFLLVACGGSVFESGNEGSDGGGSSGGGGSSSSGGTSSSGTGSSGAASSSGASGGGNSSGGGSSNGGPGGGSGGSSGSGSGGSGNSSGGLVPGCPSKAPIAGYACAPSGIECEYGNGTVPPCDAIARCGPSGWTVQGPMVSGCGAHPAGCPATYASIGGQGVSCSTDGLVCDYPEGRCECAVGGGPVRLVDGSVSPFWFCQSPGTSGCPQPRPRLGTSCSGPSFSCDYGGGCAIEGGNAEVCTNGVWTSTPEACPL